MATMTIPNGSFLRFTKASNNKFGFVAGTVCPFDFRFLNGLNVDDDLSVGAGSENTIECEGDIIAFASSDSRFKDNVINIPNPLEKLNRIRGVKFTWNEHAPIEKYRHTEDVGVIAQEIELVLPELVRTNKEGHKSVKYDKLVSLVIEAVKAQQVQIRELQAKIEELS